MTRLADRVAIADTLMAAFAFPLYLGVCLAVGADHTQVGRAYYLGVAEFAGLMSLGIAVVTAATRGKASPWVLLWAVLAVVYWLPTMYVCVCGSSWLGWTEAMLRWTFIIGLGLLGLIALCFFECAPDVAETSRKGSPAIGSPAASTSDAMNLPPLITVTKHQEERIDSVLTELDRNYGGTLVCDPADAALDSSAFVQRYLRRFASAGPAKTYSYRFERLLARLSQFPGPLDDARLDADIWASFRAYEAEVAAATDPQESFAQHDLTSARDLLWTYLGKHAKRIQADASRKVWWLDRLFVDPATPAQRLAHAFAVLELVEATRNAPDVQSYAPADRKAPPPSGAAGLAWFAGRLEVGWRVWGLDPATLPAPRIDYVNISGRMTQFYPRDIVDQESWSRERRPFTPDFWVPVGQREDYAHVCLPDAPCDDGLFFYLLDGVLHAWPKAQMGEGALRMLEVSGFVDAAAYEDLVRRAGARALDSEPGWGAARGP
jgi:hypothetical protein